jgi:hypothetical protein
MSDILKNLQDALDNGDFNSEAAKKIKEIDERADDFAEMKTTEQMEESLIGKAVEEGGIKTGEDVDKEKVAELNSEYEKKMEERAKEEVVYATIAGLMNLDEELEEKLYGLGVYVRNLRAEYMGNPLNDDLFKKLDELEEKYDFSKYIAEDN